MTDYETEPSEAVPLTDLSELIQDRLFMGRCELLSSRNNLMIELAKIMQPPKSGTIPGRSAGRKRQRRIDSNFVATRPELPRMQQILLMIQMIDAALAPSSRAMDHVAEFRRRPIARKEREPERSDEDTRALPAPMSHHQTVMLNAARRFSAAGTPKQ